MSILNDNGNLGYLPFPFESFTNINGKPLTNGHMEVYLAGTDTRYISYSNFDGTQNPFKIPFKADARVTVLVEYGLQYDVYVYDSYNNLVASRLNLMPVGEGDITIDGWNTTIQNSDGTLQVSLTDSRYSNNAYNIDTNNVALSVQEPLLWINDSTIGIDPSTLTGIEGITELSGKVMQEITDREAGDAYLENLINGKQDALSNEQLSAISSVSGKQDALTLEQLSAISSVSGKQDLLTNEQLSAISSVSGKQDALTVQQLSAISSVSGKQDQLTNEQLSAISSVSGKQDTLTFGYNDKGEIETINTSAIAGNDDIEKKEVIGIDGIKIEENETNIVFSTTGMQAALTNDQLSAISSVSGKQDKLTQGKNIVINGSTISVADEIELSATGYYTTLGADGLGMTDRNGDYVWMQNDVLYYGNEDDSKLTTITEDSIAIDDGNKHLSMIGNQVQLTQGNGSVTLKTTSNTGEIGRNNTEIKVVYDDKGSIQNFATIMPQDVQLYDAVTNKTISMTAMDSKLDNKLDTTAFSEVSGSFATKQDIPSVDGFMNESDLGFTEDGKIASYKNSAFAGSEGKTYSAGPFIDIYEVGSQSYISANVPETWTLEAGEGLELTEDEDNKKTIVSVTGTYANEAKFEYDSNNKISAYNGSAFAGQGSEGKTYTGVDPIYVDNDKDLIGANVEDFGLQQIVLDDTMTYETAEGSFTIGVNTKNVMAVEDLGYDSDGKIVSYKNSAFAGQGSIETKEVIGTNGIKIEETGDYIEISTTGLQTALSLEQLSAISSVSGKQESLTTQQLSAISSVSGKQDELTFGYNADGQIESINTSAIAGQGGQGKTYTGIDPIYVDNTNDTISADTQEIKTIKLGDGLKIEDGVIKVVGGGSGVDETVLWEGDYEMGRTSITLSESCKNFEELKIIWMVVHPDIKDTQVATTITYHTSDSENISALIIRSAIEPSNVCEFVSVWLNYGTTFTKHACMYAMDRQNFDPADDLVPVKIIGIKRIGG